MSGRKTDRPEVIGLSVSQTPGGVQVEYGETAVEYFDLFGVDSDGDGERFLLPAAERRLVVARLERRVGVLLRRLAREVQR